MSGTDESTAVANKTDAADHDELKHNEAALGAKDSPGQAGPNFDDVKPTVILVPEGDNALDYLDNILRHDGFISSEVSNGSLALQLLMDVDSWSLTQDAHMTLGTGIAFAGCTEIGATNIGDNASPQFSDAGGEAKITETYYEEALNVEFGDNAGPNACGTGKDDTCCGDARGLVDDLLLAVDIP